MVETHVERNPIITPRKSFDAKQEDIVEIALKNDWYYRRGGGIGKDTGNSFGFAPFIRFSLCSPSSLSN